MKITKSKKALERKYFLMRGLECKNISQEDYDAEIKGLEKEITANLQEVLAEEHEKLKNEVVQVKKTIFTDGNMKKGVAKVLITFLRPHFSKDEIKGIMRQGYKICRRE